MAADRNSHRIFSGLILFVLAYEWLVSGLDKILSGGFVAGLNQQLSDALSNMQYGFYAALVRHYFIPNSELVGYGVEIGELILGITFATLAVYALRGRMTALLYRIAIVVGVLAAFVSLNLFFYQGGSFFVNTADPYDEGVSVEIILVLANIAVVVWGYVALHAKPKLYLVGNHGETGNKYRNRASHRRVASK